MVVAQIKEQQVYDKLIEYQQDPEGFMTTCLDVKPKHYWSKMREIAESVRDNQFTAVPACHSVSKTYLAGRIAVWFKSCYFPSTVVTTAPSDKLVKEQLWREIHTAHTGAKVPLGGKMNTLDWDLKPSKEVLQDLSPEQRAMWEKNFAIGFSTSPDTATQHATKMHGYHNKWVLMLFDEAGGILKAIWKAALEGMIINERCKILVIGNPTDPTGYFHKVCKPDSGWNVINISVSDTPNYQEGREVIPNVAGRDYYNRMKKEHGENSNTFKIRVLGQFPEWLEGTFFGSRMAEAERDGHIGDYPWEPSAKVYTFADYGDIYSGLIFAQFIQGTIRIIDFYYDNAGVGVPGYCKVMDSKPYVYAKVQGHWAGPDLDPEKGSNRKSLATGKTIVDEFAQLGYGMSIVDKHTFNDGIEDVFNIFPKLRINRRTCKDLVIAVKTYHKKKNEAESTDDKPAYYKEPVDNWTKHVADALRHLARAYRWQLVIDGQRIGYPHAIPANIGGDSDPYGNFNPLNFGRRRA